MYNEVQSLQAENAVTSNSQRFNLIFEAKKMQEVCKVSNALKVCERLNTKNGNLMKASFLLIQTPPPTVSAEILIPHHYQR